MRKYKFLLPVLMLALVVSTIAGMLGTVAASPANSPAAAVANIPNSGNANANLSQPAAKSDPNKVVDGVRCGDVSKLGIDKQMNAHASLIMLACGLIPAASGNKSPVTGGNMALPANYGGTDVDVILPDGTYPNVTESESFVWGHGSIVVVNYNRSPAGTGCYSGLSYSIDGGATFIATRALCAGHGTNYGDPTVVWDNMHSVWVATDLATGCGGQGVGAWRSTDGITWTAGGCAMNSSSGDRNSSWVDNTPSSPHYGTVYSSYNDFAIGGGALYVSRSTDGGTTWMAGVQLNPGFIRDVQITGAADGTVLEAAMNENGGGLGNRNNIFYRSTDGGATFTQVYSGPSFYGAGRCASGYFAGMYCNPTGYWRYMSWGQPAGGPQLAGQNVFHYVYSMGISGTDPGNVMYIRSTDNGATWSAPLQLNTDTTNKAQWMPSLSETSSGALMATWFDERNNGRSTNDCAAPGTNSPCYEYYGRVSLDQGATWQADMPVSDAISPLPNQPDPGIQTLYVGDYNYASADGNTAYTTWVDGRTLINNNSQQDVYFDKVPVPVGTPTPTVTGTPPTATPTRTNTTTPTSTPTPCFGPNPVVNGGFETGSFAPWVVSDTIPNPMVVMTQAHSGTHSAFLGSLSPPEPTGSASITQTVSVPSGGAQLSYWYYPNTTDTITFDWQDAYIENTSGVILATVMHVAENDMVWKNKTFDMTPYAGQTVRIVFLVHQDGFGDPTGMYVDDVSMAAIVSCATNTPGGPTNTPQPPTATATPTQCGASAAWTAGPPLPTTLVRAVGVYFPANGKFYTMGGRTSDSAGSDVLTPYEYTPGNPGTWAIKAAMYNNNQVNNQACGVLTVSGTPYIFCVGGSAATQTTATAQVRRYNPATDTLTQMVGDDWPGDASGTILPGGFAVVNNKLYILGGFDINTASTNQIWEYDPNATGSHWTQKVNAPAGLMYAPAAAINNIIYVAGASDFQGGTVVDTSLSFSYNPATNMTGVIANIPRATGETRAVVVNNKMWVLGGGRVSPNPSNQVDVYDPVANTWSMALNFNNARRNFPADSDPATSRVWLAGGYEPSTAAQDMEIYRPATTCASPTPAPPTATATNTPVPPTATRTATPVPPTSTATNTPAPTNTPGGPTNTRVPTNTPVPPTATMTNTPGGPTATAVVPTVTPTDCPNPFVDINNNVFYYAIHYLYCRGVVNGTDPTHYSPGGTSTRAQFAKVVVLGFGLAPYTPAGGTQDFTDVPNTYWAYAYIETGFHAGILSGFDAPNCTSHGATYPCYLPNLAITRGQLTKLVVLAGSYPPFTPTGGGQDFSDVPPTYVFYVSIETAFHNNIIAGYPDGTFKPNNNIRRDEMAQIVYKGIINRP